MLKPNVSLVLSVTLATSACFLSGCVLKGELMAVIVPTIRASFTRQVAVPLLVNCLINSMSPQIGRAHV